MNKNIFLKLLFICCVVNSSFATTYTVSSSSDSGVGSLRQAIIDSNTDGTAIAGFPHIINITLDGQININTALPVIANHCTINGDVLGTTIYRANTGSFYRILEVSGARNITLNNLILKNGNPGGSNPGGAILNSGATLTLNNCVLDGNNSEGHGGAIQQTSGTLAVNNTTIKNNNSGVLGRGAAIYIFYGTTTLSNCTVHSNQSGDNATIYAVNGVVLNLINCTVVNNHSLQANSSVATGGIFYEPSATLNLTNTILANNTSVGKPNSDLSTFASVWTGINNNNIVENCGSISPSFCPSAAFASSADPLLSTITTSGLQDAFRPGIGSYATNNGTASGTPITDIFGATWIGGTEIGSVEATIAATAIHLDGTNDYINIVSPYTSYTNAITVEAWVNITSISTAGAIIGQATANTDSMTSNVWKLHANADNTISFYVNDNGTWRIATSTTAVVGTGWHHIAGTANGTNTTITIDGTFEGTGSAISTGIQSNASAAIHIGKDVSYDTGKFMNGIIDEVRIWNDALCILQISGRKNCELTGSEANLVSYYKFNQGAVAANNTTETTVTDTTGNGHHGTTTNMALTGATSNWVDGTTNGVSNTCSFTNPEIDILGNSVSIINNNTSPSTVDHTDFGTTATSVVRTFTVDNTNGTAPLSISGIIAFGGNSSDFIIGALSSPSPIAAGASSSFDVTFTPGAFELRSTQIYILNNDCNEETYLFSVQGTGEDVLLSSDNNNILSGVNVYTDSNEVNIHLNNLSNISLKIYDLYGKIQYTKNNITDKVYQFSFNKTTGIYILELRHKNAVKRFKIVL